MAANETPNRSVDLPLAELISLSSDPVALFDRDDRLIAANDQFRARYAGVAGFLEPETDWTILLLEIERHGILSGRDCDQIRLIERDLIDLGSSTDPLETRGPNNDTWLIRLSRTSNGGFAWVQSEVVDRKAQAEHQREADLLMAKVLEACPASLTMFQIGDGQILYRSPAATELLGSLRNINDHFVDRIERGDFITALLSNARVDDMRMCGRRPDGTEFPASISARLIDYRSEEVIVASIMDISDDLSMQGELARQKELNFQSEKMSALGELLAGVAHELNNPLSIVVGNAMMLQEELQGQDSSKRVGKLVDAAERCVRIVRTFLAMVREQPLDIRDVSVSDMAETACDAFRDAAPDLPIEVETDIPSDLPPISVDEVQITQVLVNLLTNAQHAMADTGRYGRVTIAARPADAEQSVVLTVQDDGPGIPDEIRSRVFDPLFTTKVAGRGTGMGLSLCQRIVFAHGGSIRLASPPGVGATFEIRLPTAWHENPA